MLLRFSNISFFQMHTSIVLISNSAAISLIVLIPLIASNATRALKSGVCYRL